MSGPTKTNLPVTAGSGSPVAGYTDGDGNFAQAIAYDSNPVISNTAWSSSTTANTALTTNCAGYGTVVVTYVQSSTISAGVVTFEAYDGVNWWMIPATRMNGLYSDPGTYSLANGSQAWQVNAAGFQQIRVRLSTAINGVGTGTFQILIQGGNLPIIQQTNLSTALNQSIDSITTYVFGSNYTNVVATGTTTVKSGAGFLRSISVNNPAALASATTATTIVMYDGPAGSATKIGTLSLPPSANLTSSMPINLTFEAGFNTGLTLVITLGTSGSWTPDITVVYR